MSAAFVYWAREATEGSHEGKIQVRSVLLMALTILSLGYIAACAFLYFTQDSAIFYPRPNDPQLQQQQAPHRIAIPSGGAKLEGWWVENPDATNDSVILYFGGNAEDVLHNISTLALYSARQMVVANYRGYGGSRGKPSQDALYQDGLAIYDFLIGRGVASEHIVVMGRSLGSGVASMIAAERPIRAAILITPFDSLAAVAAAHYRWLPVKWLLRHPFPSINWARKTQAPVLILAASEDYIVPSSRAQALFDAWQGKKQIHILPGAGHNDIQGHPDYYRLINEFLAAIGVGRPT